MPPPSLDDVGEVRRLNVAVRAILRNGDPRLRAPRPDMSDRKEPARVVEIARLHDGDLGVGAWLMKKPAAALRAKQAVDRPPAFVRALPHRRLSVFDDDRLSFGEKRKTEGAARLPLTFGAVACVDRKR